MNTAIKDKSMSLSQNSSDNSKNLLTFEYQIKKDLSFKERRNYSIILSIISLLIIFLSPNLVAGRILLSYQLRSPNWLYLLVGWILFISAVLLWRKTIVYHKKEADWDDLKKKSKDWIPLDSTILQKHVDDYKFWKGVARNFNVQRGIIIIIAILILVFFTFADQLGVKEGVVSFFESTIGTEYGGFAYFLSIYPMIGLGGTVLLIIILVGLGFPPFIPITISTNLTVKTVIDKYKTYENLIRDINNENLSNQNKSKGKIEFIWLVKQKRGSKFTIPFDLKLNVNVPNTSEWCMGIQSQITYNMNKPYLYFVILVKRKIKGKRGSSHTKAKKVKLSRSLTRNTTINVEKSDDMVVPIVVRKTTSKTVYSTTISDCVKLFDVCLEWMTEFEKINGISI